MPHYTTFDVHSSAPPAQVMSAPRPTEPLAPRPLVASPTSVGSPLALHIDGPVQFNSGAAVVHTSPDSVQNIGLPPIQKLDLKNSVDPDLGPTPKMGGEASGGGNGGLLIGNGATGDASGAPAIAQNIGGVGGNGGNGAMAGTGGTGGKGGNGPAMK